MFTFCKLAVMSGLLFVTLHGHVHPRDEEYEPQPLKAVSARIK